MDKQIILKADRDKSILRGHPWVFSGGVDKIKGEPKEGDWVSAFDSKGNYLCSGHFGEQSITLRVITRKESSAEDAEVGERIGQAFELRVSLGLVGNTHTNCYRLVNAEGDSLPGLVVDVYNSAVVIQAHSYGMLKLADQIAKILKEKLNPEIIYLRDSTGDKEPQSRFLLGDKKEVEVLENDMHFVVDFVEGQKTGFFLDQRDNRKLLSEYVNDRNVLNTFCYTGGFSIAALKGGAREVTSVDISATAKEFLDRNVSINSYSNHTSLKADCFKYLNELDQSFDVIVLDPPSLAKHKGASRQAIKAYSALNLSALSKINKNGFLFTFSCSQFVSRTEFESAVMDAAIKSKREVRIVKNLSAAACHVRSIFHPEGEYLKGLMLEVS